MTKYVLLLRGINVGGKMVSMETLRTMLGSLGYTNVKTLLNSGNVIVETKEQDENSISTTVEKEIEKVFGFTVDVLVRSMEDIQALVAREPFKNVKITPDTRLYVTFLSQAPWIKTTVLTLSDTQGTTDMMKELEKEFGKRITTRNWNTVLKIAQS
jgi:uncharacterized protein (DUF1697 family)